MQIRTVYLCQDVKNQDGKNSLSVKICFNVYILCKYANIDFLIFVLENVYMVIYVYTSCTFVYHVRICKNKEAHSVRSIINSQFYNYQSDIKESTVDVLYLYLIHTIVHRTCD